MTPALMFYQVPWFGVHVLIMLFLTATSAMLFHIAYGYEPPTYEKTCRNIRWEVIDCEH